MRILEMYRFDNHLNVNVDKTELNKFRNGGSPAQGDRLQYMIEEIEFVKKFCYLEVLLWKTLPVRQHYIKQEQERQS